MDNHFIKTIGIENFKCFEKLSITGIESVNLIGGKNNIGKTAFLEAIELFVSSNDANTLALNMYHMLTRRQGDINKNERYTVDFIKDKEKEVRIYTDTKISEIKMHLNQQQSFFEEPEEGEAERNEIISITHLSFLINKDEKSFPVNKLLRRNMLMRVDNINFIRSEKIGEQELANLYGALVDLDREDFLNQSLKIFDNNIHSLKQRAINNKIILKLKLKDRDLPVLLSSIGDGINRYIAILCAIWASKDGFLFIDEIENGIHYTNFKTLWTLIFQTSAAAHCQIFVTSHSKECIEVFNQVQDHHGGYFEFYKNFKTDLITASKTDKEQLEYSLNHNGSIRGE